MENRITKRLEMIRMLSKLSTFLILFTVNALSVSNAAEWHVIEDSSNVRFIYSLEGAAFRGRFDLFSAKINFDTDNPNNGKIVGVVKMESTNSGDAEHDAYLLEEDWFNPQNYPESRFESEQIERLKDGKFAAHGQLTLVGISQPITMLFEFEENGLTANFSGNFEVKRLLFGVGWDTTNWIADEVDVQVELQLRK
ncbi:MAG: YceI family protein [Pseudomonadota bacterium]|nr:YceI family protein [Pseudomonadota bacterium]